jgi:hypothetical protein
LSFRLSEESTVCAFHAFGVFCLAYPFCHVCHGPCCRLALSARTPPIHAGHAQVEAFEGTDFIKSYSGRIITGFEMRGGSFGPNPSKVMGAEGDPPLALRRSIDKGMAANNAGRHINFLEIYAGDVLAPDMQPVLAAVCSVAV